MLSGKRAIALKTLEGSLRNFLLVPEKVSELVRGSSPLQKHHKKEVGTHPICHHGIIKWMRELATRDRLELQFMCCISQAYCHYASVCCGAESASKP